MRLRRSLSPVRSQSLDKLTPALLAGQTSSTLHRRPPTGDSPVLYVVPTGRYTLRITASPSSRNVQVPHARRSTAYFDSSDPPQPLFRKQTSKPMWPSGAEGDSVSRLWPQALLHKVGTSPISTESRYSLVDRLSALSTYAPYHPHLQPRYHTQGTPSPGPAPLHLHTSPTSLVSSTHNAVCPHVVCPASFSHFVLPYCLIASFSR